MDEIRTEKRSVRGAFFSIVILAILYPLSIAPVQSVMYRGWLPGDYCYWRDCRAYAPLVGVAEMAPDSIGKLLEFYASVLMPRNVILNYQPRHGPI
jgi:hypothetical protein